MEESSLVGGADGLQVGDTFLEVDGEKIYVQSDFSTILSLNPGEVHDIVVERNGEQVTLKDFEMKKTTFGDEKTPRYGFSFSVVDATFSSKLDYAWRNVLNSGRIVRLSLQMLFSGQASMSDMTGPVGIVGQMSDMAEASETWVDAVLNMLYFGGFIAINLAIMNMLPIPALDGGRVLALLVTTAFAKITKKPVNPKIEGYIHAGGMILLLIFMALIMFKDIFAIFKG
jgi:regulator of sigma E protease